VAGGYFIRAGGQGSQGDVMPRAVPDAPQLVKTLERAGSAGGGGRRTPRRSTNHLLVSKAQGQGGRV
jgi:hypothetical protein